MTELDSLERAITRGWEERDTVTPATGGALRTAVDTALALLDEGRARVAEPDGRGGWRVNDWLKMAVLLSFRLEESRPATPSGYDKVPLKTAGWTADDHARAGFRMVPGAIVRRGAHVAQGAVLMPSFVNIGAFVGPRTMIDTWATVGSCAQIGADVHISGGAGIGGVLEPLQAQPVIIEDGVFVGARSEVAEGVIVREGAVLAMGVFLGASTRIVDRATGAVTRGEVPPYAVVVPGALPGAGGGPALSCAVIVKRVDAQTRSKTGINALLRDI